MADSSADRLLSPVFRRLDMMIARGVLRGTDDTSGIQREQVGVLEGETLDNVERFQTYGLSAVPPDGSDVLINFLQGNRDHPVIVAVNDRGSRPKGLQAGEVSLYNNAEVAIVLAADGALRIRAKTIAIEADEGISIKAETVEIEGDVTIDGDLVVTGTISEGGGARR